MSKKILCPECKSTIGFEEITYNVGSSISLILDKNGDIQFGIPEIIDDGEHKSVYCCVACGYQLENVSNIDEFSEWLKNHILDPYYMTCKFGDEETLAPWRECEAETLIDSKTEAEYTFNGYNINLYVGVLNESIGEVNIIAKRPALKNEWVDV